MSLVPYLTPDDLLTSPLLGTTIEVGMAFVRVKRQGNRSYYYLVENRREGPKVRQKVIKYLGATPPTKEELEAMLYNIRREK